MVNVLEAHRELWNLVCEYDQYLHNESGLMNKFWQQYLDMREICLIFINLWEMGIGISLLHYITFYWVSQLNLSQSHPNMLKEFQRGNFSVRRAPGISSTAYQQIKLLSRQ